MRNVITVGDAYKILQEKYECKYYQWVSNIHEGVAIHEEGYVCETFNSLLFDWMTNNINKY
jgi:hypothetical protein